MSRQTLVNIFNTLGYLALTLQWLWLALQFMPLLLETELFQPVEPAEPAQSVDIPPILSPLAVMVALLSAGLAIAVGVYAAAKMPKQSTRLAEKSTHQISELAVKNLAKGKKLTKKRKLQLSSRLQLIIKLSLALLAFCLLYASLWIESPPLEFSITLTIGWLLLPWPILWFLLAYLIKKPK